MASAQSSQDICLCHCLNIPFAAANSSDYELDSVVDYTLGEVMASPFPVTETACHWPNPPAQKQTDYNARAQDVLRSGAVRLLSAKWLVKRPANWIMQRLQDLPEEAFIDPSFAAELYSQKFCMVVLSYGWLTPRHPDPTGFYLRQVQSFLKKHISFFQRYLDGSYDFPDYGLFWDFGSLPQVGVDGKRTAEEKAIFDKGLSVINLLYGSDKSYVVQLKRMPEIASAGMNATPYDMRGWCVCEEMMAGIVKPSFLLLNLGCAGSQLDDNSCGLLDVRDAEGVTSGRRPPVRPERMKEMLKTLTFTNGGDREKVAGIYHNFFLEICSSTTHIYFVNFGVLCGSPQPGWGPQDAAALAETLLHFSCCHTFWISGHALGDDGVVNLVEAWTKMNALEHLFLVSKEASCIFGQRGLDAITEAWNILGGQLRGFIAEPQIQEVQKYTSRFSDQ